MSKNLRGCVPARAQLFVVLCCISALAAVSSSDAMEQVRVTAQRYEQDLQQVPLSVSVIDGDAIARWGAVDVGDLTRQVPGFAANTGGLPTLYMRGIGSNDLGAGGDPSVGSYQDGIYLGRSAGQIFDLLDVERVEIIRGPQGVLFGRNSAGGAINVITRKPSRALSAEASQQIGSFGERRFMGVANLPINTSWALRVAVSNLRRDGFVHNDFDDSDMLAADQRAARATLLFEPGTSWRAQLQLSSEDKDTDGASGRSANPAYLPGDPYDDYFSDLNHSLEQRNIRFGNLRIDYEAGDWQFSSITAYRTLQYDDLVDSTGTGLRSVRLYAGTDEENRQFSQDFLGHFASDSIRSTVGASFYRQHADQWSHLESTSETVNFAVSRQLGFPVVVLPPGRDHEENSRNGGEFTNESVFVDTAWAFAERWEVLGGLRYSHDDKQHFVDGMGSNNGIAIVFPNTPKTPTEADWSDWSPRVGLSFQATPALLMYANYSDGFKSGGFNSFVPNAEFDPEQVAQFEFGAKWQGWQQRLTINAAAFDYRYRDLQVSVIENGRAVIRNAASAQGRGVDFDIALQVAPHMTVGMAAGWLDAEFVDFSVIRNGVVADYAGNTLTYSPDKQISAFMNSSTPLDANWKLLTDIRFSFSGKQYFDVSNDPELTENAVNLFDASVGIAPVNERWRVTLFGRNLSDTNYVLMKGGVARDTLNAPTSRRGMPRTLGIRVEAAFP